MIEWGTKVYLSRSWDAWHWHRQVQCKPHTMTACASQVLLSAVQFFRSMCKRFVCGPENETLSGCDQQVWQYWNLDRVKGLLVHSKEDLKHHLRSLTSVNPFAPPLELFLVSLEAVFFLPAVRYLSSFSAFASASKINNVWWGWSTAVRSISYKTISTQIQDDT